MNLLSRQNKLYFEFPKIRKKERNKNPMKSSKQKLDVQSDAKFTSWRQRMTSLRQRKTSTSDDRIKLFPSMKTINLSKIRLTLLNYNLSKMANSRNDCCFRQMSSRQRKAIGFETFFLKNMPNKKILKVIKFQSKSSSTRGIKTKKH